MKKLLNFIFGFEVAAMVLAFLIFKTLSDRTLAGMVAGTVFVALGFTIFGLGLKDKEFRKTFTFWLGMVHLFLISIPMMATRIATLGNEFSSIMILGIVPGPVFHKISEMLYVILVVGTVIDRIRYRAFERANKNGG